MKPYLSRLGWSTRALALQPLAAAAVAWLGNVLLVTLALIAPQLLLFPDGRLPSARWRLVVWLAGCRRGRIWHQSRVHSWAAQQFTLDCQPARCAQSERE